MLEPVVIALVQAGFNAAGPQSVPAPAPPTAASRPVRIVTFGDGALAGRPGVEKSAAQRLDETLRDRGRDVEVIDAAIDGNTTEQARRRFQWDVLDREPDLVVIQFGLDDAGTIAPETFESNLDHFATKLRERGIAVVLATPSPLLGVDQPDPWAASDGLAPYLEAVRAVAGRRDLGLIDLYTYYREFVVDAALALEFLPDGRHPNDQGHGITADLLAMMAVTLLDDGRLRPRDVRRQPLRGPDPAPSRGCSIPVIDLAGGSAPRSVADRGPGKSRCVPGTVHLADGQDLRVFHDDGRLINGAAERATTSRIYATRSADAGRSWTQPEPILTHPAARLAGPCIVRSPDGRRLALLMGDESGAYNSLVSISHDQGATWSPPRELPGCLTGAGHVASVAPGPAGRIVAVFRDGAADSTRGDWVGWVGTFDDLVQGREGACRLRLLDGGDCEVMTLDVLPEGTFVATCGADELRFSLAEIDARKEKDSTRRKTEGTD